MKRRPRSAGHAGRWDRDHVFLQRHVVADARIEPFRDDVDASIVGHHVDDDVGILRQKGRHHGREHEPRRRGRHVESQSPRGSITELIHLVERVAHLSERGSDALEESCAGFGQRDAAGGPMEQAHAETSFESAHGVAQLRRARSRHSGGASEAALAGDGEEGGQVGELVHDCAD